ncbi:molybdenum cofactor biosynthesis protein MoaA [Ignicoccus pacificus DSM 13166]|uniref:Probable GTP 3',8-cyclase n=1 Tax=Ignicoccus pacificus DSM 13166 TaxID=940294 RepID=A0A977KBA0_9CREN|nr:molybdenum cofactor biosynthesis protein MoaA [Ignicoccus pacificus DSM 13166]
MTIYDAYGRPFKSLRIAVTDLCNFKCFFCHREGVEGVKDELNVEEFALIAKASRALGAEDVKLTGGEPLLKPRIEHLVAQLNEIGFKDISMTTNGYLLKKLAPALIDSGLKRINVSLHSLRRERFRKITGVDALERVVEGIQTALELGLPVTINVTVLKGINEDELMDLISFASSRGMNVHLIELHPVGRGKDVFNQAHSFPDELLNELEKRASRKEIRRLHNRLRFIMENGSIVELVRPVSNPLFCAGCLRIRVSPDGKLYPCLNEYNRLVDVKDIIRSDLEEDEKIERIMKKIVEINRFRRPYAMWSIQYEKEIIMGDKERWCEFKKLYRKKNFTFRIGMPKRDGTLQL